MKTSLRSRARLQLLALARRQPRAWINYALLLFQRVREDRCLQIAGSLTFSTLLAIVPLLTIGLTVFAALPAFSGFSTTIREFVITNLVPTSAGKVMTIYVQQFADNAGRLTFWGVAILGVSAFMTVLTIDRAFNTIWRVRRPRPLISRLAIYWAVLTVGPLLIGASLSVTSWLLSLSMGAVRPGQNVNVILLKTTPVLLTCVALALLYRLVPNRQVALRDAALGALLAGLCFEAMKSAFGAYIKAVPTLKLVYGAFASFPIFLLWIYVSWLIIVLGAEISATLPYLRSGGVQLRRRPSSQLSEGVRLLRQLYEAHSSGRMLDTEALRAAVRLTVEDCEALLERLAKAGWIANTADDRWVLARDAEEIKLGELYAEFVFRADVMESTDPTFEALVSQLVHDARDTFAMSLKTFFSLSGKERQQLALRASKARARS